MEGCFALRGFRLVGLCSYTSRIIIALASDIYQVVYYVGLLH